MIGLGGNQGQTIKFSPYKGMKYFIPISYTNQHKFDEQEEIERYNLSELNKTIGITTKEKKNESTR
jgi:hypothetical protein